jgi:hypothetical protein
MELAIAGMVAGTALTATSQVMQGQARSEAAAFEQQQLIGQQKQLQAQAENTRIAADQAETARRERLVANIESIQSIRAGRGVGEASPSGMAFLDSITDNTERDIGTERFNYLSKADQSRMAAENAGLSATMAGRKAQTSLLAGYLDAGSTVASAGWKYATMQAGGGYRGINA